MKHVLLSISLVMALNPFAQTQFVGVSNHVNWNSNTDGDATLKLSFTTTIKPVSVSFGFATKQGLKAIVTHEGSSTGVDLVDLIGFFDENLVFDGYSISAATHDFDSDKNPELIVSFGDGSVMSVCVLKYFSPENTTGISIDNWKVLGTFEGQDSVIVEGKKIVLPYGSQGLFDEYTLTNGKFLKTS